MAKFIIRDSQGVEVIISARSLKEAKRKFTKMYYSETVPKNKQKNIFSEDFREFTINKKSDFGGVF